jgi:alpha-D-ribose 1-methylphosphonate 5-triphosphate diphosphatase
MLRTIIHNGTIVTPDRMFEGELWIERDKITAVHEKKGPATKLEDEGVDTEYIDASGMYVLPGLIDLHGDMLEKAIQPRKGVIMPIPLALHTLQDYLLSAGITTMLHAISFVGEPGLRSNESGFEIAKEIIRLREGPSARLRHHLHVRYELVNDKGCEQIFQMIDEGWVDLISIMDHTPQYGKYRTLDEYRYYVEKTHQLTGEACDRFIEEQRKKRESIDVGMELKLISRALENGIALSSHDDDTPAKVDELRAKGATISEFPLNDQTAAHAKELGMFAVVGGPNVLRGYSHENHLSARHALKHGWANIICSDYYPFSIISSVFVLFEEGISLPEAVSHASLSPARALGWGNFTGSLEAGKTADLILVSHAKGGQPQVERAMVDGQWKMIHPAPDRD